MASNSNPYYELTKYEEETRTNKFIRKAKEAPYVPIGISGALMGLLYGAYKFKNRGNMSTSIYLIHMRVAAQGAVVSALTLGVAYTLLKDYVFTQKHNDE